MKVILLMGGEGKRFENQVPKQFVSLSGKRIYLHTLEKFLAFKEFEEIVLVCHRQWIPLVRKEVEEKRVKVIEGGTTRQNSSYRGLIACGQETDFVLIHDAVRPFVSKEIIEKNIQALKTHAAVDTCIPLTDTLVHAKSRATIKAIPNRFEYLRGQTPQSFSYPVILKAHKQASTQVAVDDCSLVLKLGYPVHIIEGSSNNIKITNNLDLFLAEQLLRFSYHKNPLPSSFCFKDKKYVIAGGTGGIGTKLAELLEKKGALVLLLSKSSKNWPIDLTNFKQTQKTFEAIFHKYGLLDGLINATGFLSLKSFQELSSEDINHLIAANLHTTIYSCRLARIKKGGHIINFSSSAFYRGRKEYTIYSATKAAIVNFTQGLAEEFPDLCVNVMVPQRTNTSMRRNSFPNEDPKRLLSPEEVAKQALSLLKSHHVTGTIIDVKKT